MHSQVHCACLLSKTFTKFLDTKFHWSLLRKNWKKLCWNRKYCLLRLFAKLQYVMKNWYQKIVSGTIPVWLQKTILLISQSSCKKKLNNITNNLRTKEALLVATKPTSLKVKNITYHEMRSSYVNDCAKLANISAGVNTTKITYWEEQTQKSNYVSKNSHGPLLWSHGPLLWYWMNKVTMYTVLSPWLFS